MPVRAVLRRRHDPVDGNEQCDDGPANGVVYSGTCGSGCTSTCQIADCCGDSIVDAAEGEECDLGNQNGTPGAACSATCKIRSASIPLQLVGADGFFDARAGRLRMGW